MTNPMWPMRRWPTAFREFMFEVERRYGETCVLGWLPEDRFLTLAIIPRGLVQKYHVAIDHDDLREKARPLITAHNRDLMNHAGPDAVLVLAPAA